MKLCVIGFSLCVFPVAGSPGFQSGGARLQACGKSASTRRASAPALRPVAQPFLAVRLWSVGSPLTAFFATSGDEAMCYRLQPVCLSCRWKPRISIRGSTPSGVRKKRKHTKGFSPGPAPSGTAIPGCAPVECGQSTYRLLRHFSFSRHSFTLLAPSLSAAGRLRGERSRRATVLRFLATPHCTFTIDGRLLAFGAHL